MRSIRRSLLGYFLVLLALAFGAVWLFVDRFAKDAVLAREKAETERLMQAYTTRHQEALKKFDDELLREAKVLGSEYYTKFTTELWRRMGGRPEPGRQQDSPLRAPEGDVKEYSSRVAALLSRPPVLDRWPTGVFTQLVSHPRSPAWSAFETPRAVLRLPVAEPLKKALEERKPHEDEEHIPPPPFPPPAVYQFTVVAAHPNRNWQVLASAHPPRQTHELPIDYAELARQNVESQFDHNFIEVPNQGKFRQVVTTLGTHGRFLAFPIFLPSTSPVFVAPPPGPGFSGRRPPDASIRFVVHYARPYAELEARLSQHAAERDEQIRHVQEETQDGLAQLRTQLSLISVGSFLAMALGGWFIVARGLYPITTLSNAVSQVSEKDFRLPVERIELSHELAPIHARLTQTLDQLRRAFNREKEAVADISHELRTPIASLLATIDVTLRKPRTPEQYRIALDECRGITRQLSQLVERIMTLASLDAGSARTSLVRADAAELAAACAAVIRPLATANTVALHTDITGPLELDTDPDKLREVLMNLLHNAVEYNQPDGRIDLTGRREADRIVLTVRDTGIGMPPEVRERIFERFFRADPSRHATGVHAGLGLAIVKEYVERLNGSISVKSEAGVGTTFRIEFTAAPQSDQEPPNPTPLETPAVGPKSRGAAVPASS